MQLCNDESALKGADVPNLTCFSLKESEHHPAPNMNENLKLQPDLKNQC